MATAQSGDGSFSAVNRGDGPPGSRWGVRLAAIILTAAAAGLAVAGLVSFIGRFLLPASLPGAAVQLVEAGVILLVPAAILSAIGAALAWRSRARIAAGCAAGILAICLLFIGATGCLYRDFSTRQRLAARQCRPGWRLTFSCQPYSTGVLNADSLEAARLVVAQRLDPLALGRTKVVATPPGGIAVELDRRLVPHQQERIDALVHLIQQRGILEFRILPTIDREELSAEQIEQRRRALSEKGPASASDNSYVWIPIRDANEWHGPTCIVEQFGNRHYVLASNRPGEVMLHEPDGGGWSVEKAHATEDEMGRRAIGFRVNERGGDLFWELTGKNGGRPLAIVLRDTVVSAPTISPGSQIRQDGIITGVFTATEVYEMVAILNCKPLPLDLSLLNSAWQD